MDYSMHALVVFIYIGTFSFFGNATLLCPDGLFLVLYDKNGNLYKDANPNLANQSTPCLPGTVIGPRRTNQNPSLAFAMSSLHGLTV